MACLHRGQSHCRVGRAWPGAAGGDSDGGSSQECQTTSLGCRQRKDTCPPRKEEPSGEQVLCWCDPLLFHSGLRPCAGLCSVLWPSHCPC